MSLMTSHTAPQSLYKLLRSFFSLWTSTVYTPHQSIQGSEAFSVYGKTGKVVQQISPIYFSYEFNTNLAFVFPSAVLSTFLWIPPTPGCFSKAVTSMAPLASCCQILIVPPFSDVFNFRPCFCIAFSKNSHVISTLLGSGPGFFLNSLLVASLREAAAVSTMVSGLLHRHWPLMSSPNFLWGNSV